MNAWKVCIIGEEPILLYGLSEQFNSWGFGLIELIKTSEFALKQINNYTLCLLLIENKYGEESYGLKLIEQIHNIAQVPMIVLSTLNSSLLIISAGIQEDTNYIILNKPCHIEDLRAAVERLLEIQIAA